MQDQFSRTRLLFGTDNMEILARSRVIVFGIGGVGSFAVEALVRSGLGAIDIVDDDMVSLTNVNRQLYALRSTVGQYKVDVAEARILDINPDCAVTKHRCFFLPETSGSFDFSRYDYVVDCIDTVKGKLHIIECAKAAGVSVISCMGAGNKVDPTQFRIADISGTSVCPLARVMRQELKKRCITDVKVLFSTEPAVSPLCDDERADGCPTAPERKTRRQVPGSNAFTPSVAGLIIAGEVIKDLTGFRGKQAIPSAR
ncbi:MAG: tRNA threonylcarbamoyladenosine dehydratase [Treponemataceae bacterium]|nr:tRNA threonylcarbamoyladenosine dehydratase [Treponemataceae bacterium]